MSTVDRRPTVARNLLGGDRRSVEAALEHWMAARPAVTRIILEGDGASVAATALGLWDVARMRGGVLPCQVVARVAATPITFARPSDAMAAACGAGARGLDTAQPQDVLLVVHPACLPAKTQARLARLPCPTVLVLAPGAVVPKAWRAHPAMVAIPTTVDSLTLEPIVEAVLEDLAPHHILLAGGGPALFGAAVASGDFLLERQGEVPTPAQAAALVREQVVVLEDALMLPAYKTAMDVWRETCARAGALLESVPAGTVHGVVMVPEQGAVLAA